jgi:hypothetical protein
VAERSTLPPRQKIAAALADPGRQILDLPFGPLPLSSDPFARASYSAVPASRLSAAYIRLSKDESVGIERRSKLFEVPGTIHIRCAYAVRG